MLDGYDTPALVKALTEAYGDAPTPVQPRIYREQLVQFYQTRDPSKVDTIDAILEAYDTPALVAALAKVLVCMNARASDWTTVTLSCWPGS